VRKDEVRKAIEMEGPKYVPIFFFNRDQEQSDILQVDIQNHFGGAGEDISEWGFRWERTDGTMGQARKPVITDWEQLEDICPPDAERPGRFDKTEAVIGANKDRFITAGLGLSGFTVMSLIAGFERILEALYLERNKVERLAEIVFGFENRLICRAGGYAIHAVGFADDWGTQSSLIVSPELWREFFKPRYRRQFDLIHRLGMKVIFHSCGYIYQIIPDLIEIGVDILNLSQPNIFDLNQLGLDFGGRVCFMCPISYQTTSLFGSKEEIFQAAQKLIQHLGSFSGGLIGYIEDYQSIGMTEENYHYCIEAFRTLGRYG